MMNWDDINTFLAISRASSVRGAAAALGVSHSTIGRRLDALEADLGIELFHRGSKGYELTAKGATLWREAILLEERAIALERRAAGLGEGQSGQITVTTPEAFFTHFLSKRLPQATDNALGPDLNFVFSDDFLNLDRGAADIAIRFGSDPGDYLIGRPLPHFAESYYLSPDYLVEHEPLARKGTARWLGWREEDRWIAQSPFPNIRKVFGLPNITAQAAACAAGKGMAMLPCFVGDSQAELVRLPKAPVTSGFDGWIVYHPDYRGARRITALAEWLFEVICGERDPFEGRRPRVA